MKASDVTFRLIKSLTKNEKRYFRLLSRITTGNKNYLLLFDAMDKLKEYDEQKIKTALRHKKFANNLTYEKNYLQKMILRSLRNFYAADEKRLGNTISDLEILTDKRIPELFLPLVEKHKKSALENDTLAEYILLSRYELRFVGNMQMGDWFVNYMENGFSGDMELIDKYKYSLFIIAKYNELNMLSAKYRFTNKSEFNERLAHVLEDPLFDGLYEKLPVKAKIAWYNFFTYYHALKFDFEKSYESSNKQLEYIRQNNYTIEKIGLFNFPAILVSHIENSLHLEKYDEGLLYCDQLFEIIHSDPYAAMKSLRDQFEVVYFDYKLNCLAFGQNYNLCKEFYAVSEKRISELNQIGGANLEISVQFCLAISDFGTRNYSETLDHLLRIFELEKETPFAYQIYPARVLYIMTHLQLGDIEYVSNYLRSFKRYFDKKRSEKNTIDTLARIFKEYISSHTDRKKLLSRIPAWQVRLDLLKSDNYEKEFIRSTIIELWLENLSALEIKSLT